MGNLHENKHVPNETRMNAELQSLIERYRSMASREGAPAHAFARLSDAYRHAGDTRLAIETAAEGLRRHAGSLLVQEALGIALLDADEDEAAVRALAPVVEKLPDNSRAACSLAVALSRLSREEQAIAALDRRLARDRFDGDALSLRAAIREGRPLDYTPAAAPIPAAPAEPPPPEPEPEIEEEAVEEKPKWSAVPMPVKRKEERGPSREEREKRKEERGELPVVPVRRPGVAPKPAPPPAIAYPPPMVVEQEERGPSREERGKRKEERGESQRPVTAIGAAHDRVPPATVAQVSASVSQGSAQGGALDDFVVRSVEGLFAGRDAAPIVLDDILSPRHFEPPPAKPPARASIDDLDSMIDE
ncbi:hypothetical protein K8I61_07035, partial [bacterium]|nr:hypothetical protein [bacterium]